MAIPFRMSFAVAIVNSFRSAGPKTEWGKYPSSRSLQALILRIFACPARDLKSAKLWRKNGIFPEPNINTLTYGAFVKQRDYGNRRRTGLWEDSEKGWGRCVPFQH